MQAQLERNNQDHESPRAPRKKKTFVDSVKHMFHRFWKKPEPITAPTPQETQTDILINALPKEVAALHAFTREFREGIEFIKKDPASFQRFHDAVQQHLEEHGIEFLSKVFEHNNSAEMFYTRRFLTLEDRLLSIAPNAHGLLWSLAQRKKLLMQESILRFAGRQLKEGATGLLFLSHGQQDLLRYLFPHFHEGILTPAQGKTLLQSISRDSLEPKNHFLLQAQVSFIESLVIDKEAFHHDLENWKLEK